MLLFCIFCILALPYLLFCTFLFLHFYWYLVSIQGSRSCHAICASVLHFCFAFNFVSLANSVPQGMLLVGSRYCWPLWFSLWLVSTLWPPQLILLPLCQITSCWKLRAAMVQLFLKLFHFAHLASRTPRQSLRLFQNLCLAIKSHALIELYLFLHCVLGVHLPHFAPPKWDSLCCRYQPHHLWW